MDIKRTGSAPSAKGPADWFTGVVRIDPLVEASDPARVRGAHVTFEPSARTAWHTHPLGQTLIVTFGVGRAQRWGGPIEEIRPGDVVWFAPGEKHWHGASPTTAMSHIAIQEGLNGNSSTGWNMSATSNTGPDRGTQKATAVRGRTTSSAEEISRNIDGCSAHFRLFRSSSSAAIERCGYGRLRRSFLDAKNSNRRDRSLWKGECDRRRWPRPMMRATPRRPGLEAGQIGDETRRAGGHDVLLGLAMIGRDRRGQPTRLTETAGIGDVEQAILCSLSRNI